MTQKAKNRGQLIDIARSYLSGENHVICREDIPEMIDDLISKVEILDIQRFSHAKRTVCDSTCPFWGYQCNINEMKKDCNAHRK